jgi:hypothetical protein
MKRLALSAFSVALCASATAKAGDFDALGNYVPAPDAVAYLNFSKGAPDRYLPAGSDPSCMPAQFKVEADDSALDGDNSVRVKVAPNCAERFILPLPKVQGSYRATVWTRHGGLDASLVTLFPDGSSHWTTTAALAPTGRTTSDGWVELASNPFSVDATQAMVTYLKVVDYASDSGVQLDALEVRPEGQFRAQAECKGLGDAVCGEDAICAWGRCVPGASGVPPLPKDQFRNQVIDVLEGRLRVYFGGHSSRALYLPRAIQELESARGEKSPYRYWNAFATAIHLLHDWHTDSFGGPSVDPAGGRLNACFIEGDADLSHAVWPRDAKYPDILVSHVGNDSAGLKPGDRLLAVDGLHPIAWYQQLASVEWGYHIATDPNTFADLVEAMGGPFWAGAHLRKWATEITVLRCDPQTNTCAATPETIKMRELPPATAGDDIYCDNRPLYHLETGGPNPGNHYVFNTLFTGAIANTAPDEKIFGLVWDNLYGGGDPNSEVNAGISAAIASWKAGARGVILDHRAGNGGTIDAAQLMTTLVRPPDIAAVIRMPIELGGYDGPNTPAEGKAIFDAFKGTNTVYKVGDAGFDPTIPVALVLHRDGSASDYMPYAMKGSPHVRLFGPHQTAGAFSTFVDFAGWGFGFQIASGDTIAPDGTPLITHGVMPDEIVEQKQSDLLAGRDSIHEAALAWVRSELKP